MTPTGGQQTPNHLRYYALAGLSAFLAFSFHASIHRRFGQMQTGLEEAARVKFSLEWDELEALELHSEAADLYRHSINHTLQAFELAHQANLLKGDVAEETKDVQDLQQNAELDKDEADRDNREASLWAIRAFGDNLASMGSATTGHELARMAQNEHELAEEHFAAAEAKRQDGSVKLREAQQQVVTAQDEQDVQANAEVSYGICKIFPFACDFVSSRGSSNNGDQTPSARASDESIRANKAVQDAQAELLEAKKERDLALELFANSSMHANASAHLLDEAEIFRQQAEYDAAETKAYRDEAAEAADEANRDENVVSAEQNEITHEQKEIYKYVNESRGLLDLAISEHRRASDVAMAMRAELTKVHMGEVQWEMQMIDAQHHVAKAGWYGLVSCVAAACLLALVFVRIVASFRYSRPLAWIVRDPPHRMYDILYLINHIFIFLLAIGFVGELLLHFGEEKTTARVAITIVFALVASVFQVTLLHFLPHAYKLFGQSDLEKGTVKVLLREDVVKKGTLSFLVFVMEMLLVWVNFGSFAFHRAYKWDNWWMWVLVAALAASYTVYLRKHDYRSPQSMDTSGYLDVFDVGSGGSHGPSKTSCEEVERLALLSTPSAHGMVDQAVEGQSFVSSSGMIESVRASFNSLCVKESVRGSVHEPIQSQYSGMASPAPSRSSSSQASMHSVPFGRTDTAVAEGYGSLVNDGHSFMSINAEIRATFIVSWKSEFEKLRLLLEILVACWAVWVVRSGIALIVKLSPLAAGVAWGRCPLWILNIFLLAILGCLAFWCTKRK